MCGTVEASYINALGADPFDGQRVHPQCIAIPSQILPPCRRHPLSEHRTPNLPLGSRKRIHNRFQPDLKDLSKELPYCLLRLRARGIVRYARAARRRSATASAAGRRRDGGVRGERREAVGHGVRGGGRVGRVGEVEEHEAGGGWGYEGGDVRGGELVDAFEIPGAFVSNASRRRACCDEEGTGTSDYWSIATRLQSPSCYVR